MPRWYQVSDGTKWTKANVQCYAGQDGEDEPRSFDVGAAQLDVLEILDRWKAPPHRYFKVKIKNRQLYMLRHDSGSGRWESAPFGPVR